MEKVNEFSYYMPVKVVYGHNSIKGIDAYINKRVALLSTSQGFVKRGLIDKITSYTDTIIEVISNVKSHPNF